MTNVIVIRETQTNRVVDALLNGEEGTFACDTPAEIFSKWPPIKYYAQSLVTEDLHNYFDGSEISAINQIVLEKSNGSHKVFEPQAKQLKGNLNNEDDVRNFKSLIKKCFTKSKGKVSIIAGEADFRIYDDEIYRHVISVYKQVGVLPPEDKTIFVCGPILTVRDEFSENRKRGSIVLSLHEHENFILYYSDRRQDLHVRLGGNKNTYFELDHESGQAERFGWFFENDYWMAGRCKKMLEFVLASRDVKLSKNPEEEFLLLTESEHTKLKQAVKEDLKKPYDECKKEDFLSIINRYNILPT